MKPKLSIVVPLEREQTVDAIARFMRGEIDNVAFDDALFDSGAIDTSVRRIHWALWCTYDDIKRHSVNVSLDGWKLYRRCIAFLRTDFPMPANRNRDTEDPHCWPFQSRLDVFRARPRLKELKLPRYNPSTHNTPIRTPFHAACLRVKFWLTVLMLLLLTSYLIEKL